MTSADRNVQARDTIGLMASGIAPRLPGLLGVIGAGQMGAGIAQTAAAKGVPVLLADASPEALVQGVANMRRLLARQVQKGQTTQQQADQTVQRIKTVASIEVRTCSLNNLLGTCCLLTVLPFCRLWKRLILLSRL